MELLPFVVAGLVLVVLTVLLLFFQLTLLLWFKEQKQCYTYAAIVEHFAYIRLEMSLTFDRFRDPIERVKRERNNEERD